MVSSINSGNSYFYQLARSSASTDATTSASTKSNQKYLEEMMTAAKQTAAKQTSDSEEDTSETLTTEDFMEMMRSGKIPPPPPMEESEETSEESLISAITTSQTESTQKGDISSIDLDGDGTISSDEYEEMISQMGIKNSMSAEDFFAAYDTNEDGEISADEMPEPGEVGKAMMSQGMVSQSEEEDDDSFSRYDTNSDGVISSDEYKAMRAVSRYEMNIESMFERGEGTLLNNQA